MHVIINTTSEDIYKDLNEYREKRVENEVIYKGVKYVKKIIYERSLGVIEKLFVGSCAYLATICILPICFDRKQIMNYWKIAITGVDKKIVLIRASEINEQAVSNDRCDSVFESSSARTRVYERSSLLNEASAIIEPCFPYEQKRKIPPLGLLDTIVTVGGKIVSEHGVGELFSESEIVEKLDIVKREAVAPNFFAEFTKHGKAIIQQRATRGCTAAATAMLIIDNGKKIDPHQIAIRNLANEERKIRDLEDAGLKAVINSAATLAELRMCILKNGSSIVSIDNKLGAHVVVVDEVSEDLSRIRLREPYHGWEITVTKEAFLNEWVGGNIIQVLKSS